MFVCLFAVVGLIFWNYSFRQKTKQKNNQPTNGKKSQILVVPQATKTKEKEKKRERERKEKEKEKKKRKGKTGFFFLWVWSSETAKGK